MTKQQIAVVKELGVDYSRFAVYGRVVDFSQSHAEILDWLQANLYFMGRGTIMLKFSTMEKASNLVTNSPIVVDGKIIILILWHRGFRASNFDIEFHVPRFLVTLLFLGLAVELRLYVFNFSGHFGWVM